MEILDEVVAADGTRYWLCVEEGGGIRLVRGESRVHQGGWMSALLIRLGRLRRRGVAVWS